jgi:ABC-type dipeptide/oligopeptide/nickel transport system permease component
VTRAAMQEVLQSDFIRTARAKGLGEAPVVLGHGLRNALLPVLTVLALDLGSYLTGSILTETIFSWPGVGRYVLTAIEKRDLPAVQGSILFLAKVDPRVAYD